MKMSLFARLVAGYLGIFALLAAGSVYAIVQLYRLNDVTHSLQSIENQMLNYVKGLTDAMLAQVRFEKKYVITRDKGLLEQFRLSQRDFQKLLLGALALDGAAEVKGRLERIQARHRSYLELFSQEQAWIEAGVPYGEDWFLRQKEGEADWIIAQLEAIGLSSRDDIEAKLTQLEAIGSQATRATILLTTTSLIMAVMLSFIITRSITRPVGRLKEKTREIARGDFTGELDVRSPPEMAELARAFNYMGSRLNELDQLKSDFFSTMSHELRTPLTSIKEGIGLLLDDRGSASPEKQQRVLRILSEESNRLIGIVNSMLDVSKMEAGMMTYDYENSQLLPLIRQVMQEMEPLAEGKHIALEADLPAELPPLRLDQERILQVLRNLIGNALKFTGQGSVCVTARHCDAAVEVSIKDSGPGILPENLLTIFDKFRQASRVGSRNGGTGLGLAIVHHVISSHGGKIWVESEPGQGSTFTFALPF